MWVVDKIQKLGCDLALVHKETGAEAHLYIVGNQLSMWFYYRKLQGPIDLKYYINLPFRSSLTTQDFLIDLDRWLNGKAIYFEACDVILVLLAGLFSRSVSQFQDWASTPTARYEEIIRRAKNAIKWRFQQIMREHNQTYEAEAWIGYNLLTMLREFKDEVVLDPVIDEAEQALAEILPYAVEYSF